MATWSAQRLHEAMAHHGPYHGMVCCTNANPATPPNPPCAPTCRVFAPTRVFVPPSRHKLCQVGGAACQQRRAAGPGARKVGSESRLCLQVHTQVGQLCARSGLKASAEGDINQWRPVIDSCSCRGGCGVSWGRGCMHGDVSRGGLVIVSRFKSPGSGCYHAGAAGVHRPLVLGADCRLTAQEVGLRAGFIMYMHGVRIFLFFSLSVNGDSPVTAKGQGGKTISRLGLKILGDYNSLYVQKQTSLCSTVWRVQSNMHTNPTST